MAVQGIAIVFGTAAIMVCVSARTKIEADTLPAAAGTSRML